MIRVAAFLACASIAGCQSWGGGYRSGTSFASQTTTQSGQVQVSGDNRVLAGIVVAVMLADGVRYYVRGRDGSMTPLENVPPGDPGRRIGEQDCTRPVNLELGNLVCR